MNVLYHYTSRVHLPRILAAEVLTTAESNVDLREGRDHAGPDVVWLTSEADPSGHGHGLDGSAVDKRAVRVTVDAEDAQLWRTWAPRRGISRAHMERLARAGGGGEHTWYVVELPIPAREWRSATSPWSRSSPGRRSPRPPGRGRRSSGADGT